MLTFKYIKAIYLLGIRSVARVAWYRLQLRLGIHPVQRVSASIPAGPFFGMPEKARPTDLPINCQWQQQHCFFGWFKKTASDCPEWLVNPFNGKTFPSNETPWWKIPDFSGDIGDIKTIWEVSRFDWALGFAQRASQGNADALDKLNTWLSDWVTENAPYCGPNWKCGQEASIRVMHLAMASLLLDQPEEPEPTLITLVEIHLQRIAPTIGYALAQNNNHGTSEAAALFIGGSWLHALGVKRAAQWMLLGRKYLEERACHLIEPDGSFSQHSVNYHRVMLDTYCMAEIWRRKRSLPDFSAALRERLAKATDWLNAFVDPKHGDAPNLGANDGARLLPLTNTDYRDYRPTVQLAMALFQNKRAFPVEGPWNMPLRWLNIPLPDATKELRASVSFPDGGYCALCKQKAFVLFRYPRFRFRPGQADALHVDMWLSSENILRDAGSYSYAYDHAMHYFKGTASHNTVQFDDRDQMPRLGRFLFGEWLQTKEYEPLQEKDGKITTAASYRDWQGAFHKRGIELTDQGLCVTDWISGFKKKAVLRWRLRPDNWTQGDNGITNGMIIISVTSNVPVRRLELTEGRESRYYLHQTNLPVLEVEVRNSANIITTIEWNL